MRLGVLDVGSNTVHLLVVDAHRGAAPLPAYSHKTELRLAEYLGKDGKIAQSGADGARLTFLAVRRWFGWSSGRVAVFDIGGGSLEIAAGSDEEPTVAVSVPLGAGRLTRECLSEDPPGKDEVKALRKRIRIEMAAVAGGVLRAGRPLRSVATSKTFRSLARICGAAPSEEGQYVPRSLDRDDLAAWLPKLVSMPSSERAGLPGVSDGRAKQLV